MGKFCVRILISIQICVYVLGAVRSGVGVLIPNNYPTPAGFRIVQLNSDTVYPEITS